MSENKSIVVLVTRAGMGDAEKTLQMTLISKYFQLIHQNDILPAVICFYADGVKLVIEGSPILESLQKLEAAGVHLVVCSTCVNYYDLQDNVAVGILGGMPDIIEAQFRADQVITL